jgi:hypothetical protein
MHDVITAFVDLVAATSGARVALGPPGRDAPADDAVRVWPWRMTEDLALHASLHSQAIGREAPPVTLHCLVLSTDLHALERLRVGLHASPVIELGERRVHVVPAALGHDTLLGLFAATGQAPRPCLAVELRATAA